MSEATRPLDAYSVEEKRALLARLLEKKARAPKTAPLSLAQERLWFLDRLMPGDPAYNIFTAVRLKGEFNVAALEQSINEIIRRHEILRTTFPSDDGGSPLQLIAPAAKLSLSVVDLGGLPPSERETEARRLGAEEAHRPFDLARGPLLRAGVLRLDEEDHVVLVTMHHIISDGWSLDIFTREVSILYDAFGAGRPSPLPELTFQYADYARQQRERFEAGALESLLSYWTKKLEGIPPLLELPADHPRPPVMRHRGASRTLVVPDELWESLTAFSRREGVTMFMTLLSAFQVLLYRYTRQDDINISISTAGRHRLETEALMGFLINNLVIRARLAPDLGFRELLLETRETLLEAYEHQDLPFEKLVEAMRPKRSLSYEPLTQVGFIVVVTPRDEMKSQELRLENLGTRNDTAKYDLTLYVTDTGAWRAFDIQYNSELFEDETIMRLLRHFEVLLRAIVAKPGERVSSLPLLPEDERRRQLREWNDTRADYPHRCIHELFEQQAARTPDAPALVCEGQTVTYDELNRRANQLARHLRALGVGAGSLVAVMMERSIELMVALLGVLKAGGAYVPLDPAYPRERLRFMLEDSRARVLLTQESSATEPPVRTTEVVYLDRHWPLIAEQGSENVGVQANAGDLAYVIYTSGSTGRPKGVMIEHRRVANFLSAMRREPGLTERDMLLAVTTLSFDIAGLELYLPLTVGGRVVIASREEATDAVRLRELLADSGATVMQATPATWSMLLEVGWAGDPRLKVLCGGEALPRRLADQLLERAGEVWNMYGPTETTIWSTSTRVEAGSREVPIGRPIANTQVYVLDERLRPVPVGVAGELYIGGDGLARGYLNRPALTAERFVPDPFGQEPGARLYRTGDLVRYLADGRAEYLGRLDHQVKVRGFRIELGEIEAALMGHPSVEHAAVLARQAGEGDTQLVGYVVAKAGLEPTTGELRGYLRDRLPDYMTPSAFVLLEEMPRTSNGKLNRAALPGIESLTRGQSVYVAPRNALESHLVRIWEDLLNVRPLGVTQSFFELGGHSLLAVRLMARIQKEIGPDLPVAALFQGETIEDLARLINEQDGSLRGSPLVPIQVRGGRRPFFCVHGIGGNVNNFYHLARHLGTGQPFYGLQAPHLHEVREEFTPIEEIAASYVEAVRDAQPEGPYLLGGYSFGSYVAFEMARQLRARGQEAALVALFDTYAPSLVNKLPEKRDVAEQLVSLAWVTSRERGQNLLLPVEELRRLGFEEQLEYFLDALRKADLAPPEIDHQLLRRFLKGYEARQKAAFSYAPPVYEGRLTVLRCREQDELFLERLRRAGVEGIDESLGWGEFSTEPVEVQEVPGHHDVMCNEPHVAVLAERLAACISRARAEQAPPASAGMTGRMSK